MTEREGYCHKKRLKKVGITKAEREKGTEGGVI